MKKVFAELDIILFFCLIKCNFLFLLFIFLILATFRKEKNKMEK